jgi:hypothetical protein
VTVDLVDGLALSLLTAFDCVDGVDETIAVDEPHVEGDTITVGRSSTRWRDAGLRIDRRDGRVELRAWVEGEGRLADVHLLGGRSFLGFRSTGSSFCTLFSPNPGNPTALVRAASEQAVVGVSGNGLPGLGHWFFTPAPLFLALAAEEGGEWLGVGVEAPVEELTFVQLEYRPGDLAFHLALAYEGHTAVAGRFEAPAVVLEPGMPTALEALRRHCERAAVQRSRPAADWWREPVFCGWGAQCALPGRAADNATQANYDAFLGALEERDVVPGTVVIDDKWQSTYGRNEPDVAKWPDLRGWIAGRHERGQHVLLWWKAWDPEGLPPELCIRAPDGTPIALDPGNPGAQELLRSSMTELIGRDGLDADGLKVDFTARTPTGYALTPSAGGLWGISLLHELLAVVYAAVKDAKADALVITHTPHPAFADVTDMVRLNDMLRLDDPGPIPAAAVVPQMRYRAAVARAALPETLIDSDDWCVPDRETWRAYVEVKPELGVPSLYYATRLDRSGEPLEDDDYDALRRTWAHWRERR